eukprot:CAMPEP_0195111766 /NCGR_PEP_ID=MMETSP0448-20130528/97092_1 /TAXON_ID=66468 /ORGANISM="Heterocapsa triquestra, Strain CCMP 448" /LENGTH=38 /DNA_ID= /DNA_START= /DNA_END= /DNA_ORIENTATION=
MAVRTRPVTSQLHDIDLRPAALRWDWAEIGAHDAEEVG